MAEFTEYPPGTPSWVDIGSIDLDASRTFYTGLFGWSVRELPVEEAGGYGFFTLGDKLIAGFGRAQSEGVWWTMYIDVTDADETAHRAEKSEGTVVMPPMDVGASGRMAIITDPAGAVFGLWQAGEHKGAELANEPGSFSWSELVTDDLDRVTDFYRDVFGWQIKTFPLGDDDYIVVQVNDRSVGGIQVKGTTDPATVPNHWLTYFAVDDCDAAVARAERLGAKVASPPITVPTVGRYAALVGPHGEPFAVIRNE